MNSLDTASCLLSGYDAGRRTNERQCAAIGSCGTWAIAKVWRPYDEPAMPKWTELHWADFTRNPVGQGAEVLHMLWWDNYVHFWLGVC